MFWRTFSGVVGLVPSIQKIIAFDLSLLETIETNDKLIKPKQNQSKPMNNQTNLIK